MIPRGFWIRIVLALLAAMVVLARSGAAQTTPAAEKEKTPQVLVVTLEGKLGTTELARCTRALRKAESEGIRWVVFRFDWAGSLGEDQDDVQALLDRIRTTDVGTVVLAKGRVTQGAAAIAVCAERLYFLSGARLGEITKPEGEIDELLAKDPDAAAGKRFEELRVAMAARLQHRKNKLSPDAEKLVLAMVDPRVQLFDATVREGGFERRRVLDANEMTALQGSGVAVISPEKLERPVMIDERRAEEIGLSSGTLQGPEQLAEALSVDRDGVREISADWAEQMVGWLEMLQPFLLVAGFVLILFEVKTPGVGLPGVLGVAFLALAMFYSYLVGLAEFTEVLLFFLGLGAILVEIFLLPGTVIFGAVGFLSLVFALVLSRQSFVLPSNAVEEGVFLTNLINLTILFVAVLATGFVSWRILPRIPWLNRVLLPPPAPVGANGGRSGLALPNDWLLALVGRTGTAATILRPAGAMELEGQRIDVVTEGEFVEAGTPVRVLYVEGVRVVVAAANADRKSENGSVGFVVLLAVLGLVLVVAEVLFVSFGVVAILSGISLFTAVFWAFQESTTFGVVMLVSETIAVPIVLTFAFKLLPKTPFGKALILEGPVKSAPTQVEEELRPLIGRTGTAVTPLRPSGIARIDGKKVDVVTRGEMLETNCAVKVVEVAGNRVVVARN